MANWKILSQTVTSSGTAREFGIDAGQFKQPRMHVIGAERTGGGSDDATPRRVLGIGTDRASARESLEQIVSRYDPSYRIVF